MSTVALVKVIAIYIRVSTATQAMDGYSLDAQEKILREYCTMREYANIRIYRDEGISGKDIKNRPAMQQLLSDVKHGEIENILVWKITRFTRSLSDLCLTCDLLDKYNVGFISYSEAFDGSTSAGRMLRNILGVIAQWERDVISENVRLALTERASRGKRTCAYVLGYDLCGKDALTINRKEAEIVSFVYKMFLKHQNFTMVSTLCIQRGYRGKKGALLQPESVHKILTHFIYCGFHSYHRQPILGNHTPLIRKKDYNQVQSLLQQKRTGRSRKNQLIFL